MRSAIAVSALLATMALDAGAPAQTPSPHGSAHSGMPGVFDPPQDTEEEDATLPPGTIAADVRDADDKPAPDESVTLGILTNSVAKGDSSEHRQATTDAGGRAVFSGLDTTSGNIAYRISMSHEGGLFAAMPFQLQQAKSMRVVLHVYPVTREQTMVVTEATVAAEMREDRVQVEQIFTFYNLGRAAWQPDDVRAELPEGFTAFGAQTTMSDQGVDEVGGAVKLRGTFPPGRSAIEFRWQLPWSGDKDIDFDVGMPPHTAIAHVMMPATADIGLVASGFPPAEQRRDAQGQRFLVTEKRFRPDDPKFTSLRVGIHDLPTQGPSRWVATLLAACCVALGLFYALRGRTGGAGTPASAKALRKVLLEDLAQLECAHAEGNVGPKTYERVRRDLVDAIARTLSPAR